MPILNLQDPNTGILRMDIGASPVVTQLYNWLGVYYADQYVIDWNWTILGQTMGAGWNYPLQSLTWLCRFPGTATTDLSQGRSQATFDHNETDQMPIGDDSKLAAVLEAYFDSPYGLTPIKLTATDSIGSEFKTINLYIHGPMEETYYNWLPDYNGKLDLCPQVAAQFAPGFIGSVENGGDNDATMHVMAQQDAEVTDGFDTTLNGSLTASLKDMLSLEFGAAVTHHSTDTIKIGTQVGADEVIDPGDTLIASWRYTGNAHFPVAANYNSVGYNGDTDLTYTKITQFGIWLHTDDGDDYGMF